MEDAYKQAFQNIQRHFPFIDELDFSEALPALRFESVPKNGYFTRAGEVPSRFAVVIKGAFRYYFIDSEGVDSTKYIALETSFLMSYSAMITCRESEYSIQALENSRILSFRFDVFKSLLEKSIHWTRFIKEVLDKVYIYMEERESSLLLKSGTERYLSFLEKNPGIESRIRQHYIASYLGLTPESLSRIKKQLNS